MKKFLKDNYLKINDIVRISVFFYVGFQLFFSSESFNDESTIRALGGLVIIWGLSEIMDFKRKYKNKKDTA